MDQFGIDLDQVLNDFEEQENRKEIENLRDFGGNDEIQTDIFCDGKVLHQSKSQTCESTSEAKISKHCLPSTNNILSSLNKYCKHFLRENVVNHVCCNDSRFHDKSPSEDNASGLDEIVEGFPSSPTNDLESAVTAEVLDDDVECDETKNIDEFDQEFLIESCICVENFKPVLLRNSRHNVSSMPESFAHLNLSQEHLLMNSEVAECVESPKSNEADACAVELPKIDLEIIPIESLPKEIFDKSFGTTFNDPIIVNAEDYSNVQSDAVIAKEGFKKTAVSSESYTEGTSSGELDEFPEGIAKSSLDEAKDHLETEHEKLTRDVDSSSVETSASEQLVVDINHDTCTFSETERIIESETSDHEANSFTLVESFAKGNEGENKEEFSFSQAKVIGKNETAGFEIGALPIEKSMSEQLVEEPIADRTIDEIKAGKIFGDHNDSSKEVECFQESSSSEEPYHAFRVQEEFDEDTFVKLSDADMRCQSSEVESQTHEQFIDVGAFNLSDMVAEDEYKNGESERKVDDNEYEDDDHDEDSIALKKLELEAAAFIEELNVAISNDSQDQITLEDESTSKDVGGSNGDKSLAITDKLQILLHEKEKLLLDELNKHKNCLPLLEQELEQIPLENDAISLEDLKSDGDDQETMDDLQKGDSFSEAKILTSKIVEAFASANDLLVQDGDDLCNGISNVAAAEARVQDSIAHHSNNVIKSDQPMDCTEDGEAFERSSNNLEEQLSRDGCINLPGETSQNVPSDSIAEIHRSSAIGQPEKKTHSNSSYPHSRPTHPGSLQFTQPQFFHAPSRCSNIDLPITDLGKVSPPWLPDSSTSKCLQCETSFSFLRRRHHCRACGLIFCNECCNVRYPLEYLNKKEERVCCKCFVDFNRASSYQNMLSSMSIPTRTSRPNPNNSSEYCSTIPPPLQAGTPSDPLPPVMVPTGVLRKQGMPRQPSENKQVMFSDGIRPGGDLTHLDERPEGASGSGSKKKKSSKSSGSSSHRRQSPLSVASAPGSSNPAKSVFNQSSTSGWSEGSLPPMVVYSAQDFGYVLDRSKSSEEVFKLATDENNRAPVLFWLNTNLTVLVKVIKKMCCAKRDLWCFTSQGMSTVGQDEVIILMEFNQSETVIPLDIFQAISAVYTSACSGSPIQNMGSIILPMSNSQEICGFLFINQTIQCVQNILLPDSPFLFGVFIKQVELTWARAFPLRLFFRLGAEFRYYPCPLFGVRDRAPVYGEIGHTIMNLLADFRNFQYSLSAVEDMAIHVEEKLTTIFLPRYKHHQVLKALSNSDDHVLALAGNFSFTADSHLVCSQNTEGSYQTQAMNIQGKIRSVTGASFVVFNGALKAASGYKAKMSIIEDGLMVQITPEDMAALKQTLGTADDFTIDCGLSSRTPPSSPGGEGAFEGMVALKWFSERIEKNSDIKSPIDKLNLSQLEHKRIHTSNVYATSEEGFVIIWTGLFFLNPSCASQTLRPEIERFSDLLASSCCKCLTPYIAFLFPPLLSKLTLRVKVSPDQIGYEAGINGSQLSNECLVALDNVVIPLLHGSSFASQPHDTSLELLFVVAKPIKA